MKKVFLTMIIIIGLSTQAQAAETEMDYLTPIAVGGGLILLGVATGGIAYVVIGVTATTAVAVGSSTTAGGAYVYQEMD